MENVEMYGENSILGGETNEENIENIILVENTTVDLATIHNDLGIICAFLIFFVLVVLLKYAYKFFNMFFII